jgi:hypothetical protein
MGEDVTITFNVKPYIENNSIRADIFTDFSDEDISVNRPLDEMISEVVDFHSLGDDTMNQACADEASAELDAFFQTIIESVAAARKEIEKRLKKGNE